MDSDMQRVQRFLYWEYDGEQAVKMGNWYGVRNLQGDLRIFDLEKDPGQHSDLSHKYPEIADKIAKIMKAEHIPSTTWPSPGETEEEFRTRLKQANIPEKPVNRNVY